MAGRHDDKPALGAGGPGDQADPAAPEPQGGLLGSQSGRPGTADDQLPPRAAPRPSPEDTREAPLRGTSEAERIAGPPDDRATTDWEHGEGEPRRDRGPA